ncbi:MAG: patatin-like phospholipase family protein [Planctomycetales bacterium]|nr:patatin-like phospholipase family protein [Planctomycetales bacterium]
MSETDERQLLFKMHPCSKHLSKEALREIASAMELVRCSIGQVVHRPDELVTSVYLIVHGRLRVAAVDGQGNTVMQRYIGAGDQFGGVAAALTEPSPLTCVAEDPSTLLRIDYAKGMELTRKHDAFRLNFTRLLADSVRRTVFNDRLPTQPQLVAFLHESDETRIVSQRLFKRLVELGEMPGVFTDQADFETVEGIRQRQTLGGERDWTLEEAIHEAARWLESGRLFIDYSRQVGPEHAAIVLERCQLVFWCVTSENWECSVQFLQEIESRSPGWRDKIRILWLLKPGEQAPQATELRELAHRDIKIVFGAPVSNQGKVLFNGFERLVHLVRGIKIGVALGGGAARGMAHLGVLKALEQNGIVVDMIAGTSAGAMTGTLYAAGLDPDYLVESFVSDLRPSWFFRCLPRGDQWYLLYKYRMGRFDPMLRKYLSDIRLEQLSLPMHTVTVDLIGGQSVVRDTGDAVHAILESINLPVLSKPINRPGQALVDGGLINNIPADVLVSKGCNFVIAVSVTAKMENVFARNRPDTPYERMRSASTIQTVLRSFLVQSTSVNAIGVQPADLVIEPDVTGFELTEFTRTDELAAIGEQTTTAAIPEIQKLLNGLDAKLFARVGD